MGQTVTHAKGESMDSDLTLLQSLVPDVFKIIRQRFLVLEQISLLAPVGRRVVAKKLGLSERNIRTETDYLKQLHLIEINSSGMVLTEKGEITLKELAPLIDRIFNASKTELQLASKLGIDRVIIVPGNADLQDRVWALMG